MSQKINERNFFLLTNGIQTSDGADAGTLLQGRTETENFYYNCQRVYIIFPALRPTTRPQGYLSDDAYVLLLQIIYASTRQP